MHRKLVAIEPKTGTPRKTPKSTTRPALSSSQNFYKPPAQDTGTFGPTSPTGDTEAAFPLGQLKKISSTDEKEVQNMIISSGQAIVGPSQPRNALDQAYSVDMALAQ